MDIKALLLDSLSSKKACSLNQHFRIDDTDYFIHFEVHGKFMNIKKIKTISKKDKHDRRSISEKHEQEITKQTFRPITSVEFVGLHEMGTQTSHRELSKKKVQHIAVQTSHKCNRKSSESSLKSVATQTAVNEHNSEMQKKSKPVCTAQNVASQTEAAQAREYEDIAIQTERIQSCDTFCQAVAKMRDEYTCVDTQYLAMSSACKNTSSQTKLLSTETRTVQTKSRVKEKATQVENDIGDTQYSRPSQKQSNTGAEERSLIRECLLEMIYEISSVMTKHHDLLTDNSAVLIGIFEKLQQMENNYVDQGTGDILRKIFQELNIETASSQPSLHTCNTCENFCNEGNTERTTSEEPICDTSIPNVGEPYRCDPFDVGNKASNTTLQETTMRNMASSHVLLHVKTAVDQKQYTISCPILSATQFRLPGKGTETGTGTQTYIVLCCQVCRKKYNPTDYFGKDNEVLDKSTETFGVCVECTDQFTETVPCVEQVDKSVGDDLARMQSSEKAIETTKVEMANKSMETDDMNTAPTKKIKEGANVSERKTWWRRRN